MEIPHPAWAAKQAIADTIMAGRNHSSVDPDILSAVEQAEVAAGKVINLPRGNQPALLGAVIAKPFLLGYLSHQVNQEIKPAPVDLSRVPRREAALEWAIKNTAHPFNMLVKKDLSDPPTLLKTSSWEDSGCSLKEIEELEKMSIKDLTCPRRHGGRVLFGRVISKPVTGIGITFHIEDSTGLVLPIHLEFPNPVPRHGPDHNRTINDKIYPIDTILAIKEPVLRYGMKGGYMLAVDVPTDIVELPPSSPLLEGMSWAIPSIGKVVATWENYKEDGNKELKNGNPIIAIRRYTIALRDAEVLSDPYKCFILLLNRSQANLELRLYGAAYRDASKARKLVDQFSLPITPMQRSRIAWRLASAAYGLRLYDKAAELAEECGAMPELEKTLPILLEKIAARKVERNEGRFDWLAMLEAVHESGTPSLDVADFTGPVEVRATAEGGWGLFVTRDVKRGELLLVSKAVVCGWSAHLHKLAYSIIDQESKNVVPHMTAFAVERLVGKLVDDRSLAKVLDGLPTLKNPIPAQIPTFTNLSDAERIRELESATLCQVDREKILDVLERNTFKLAVLHLLDDASRKSPHGIQAEADGLFGLPMVAKRVCWGGNITRNAFGDVLVIRAAQSLSKDTELLLPEPPSDAMDRPARLPSLLDTSGCPLCEADKKDDWRSRAAIIEEYKRETSGPGSALSKVENMRDIAARLAETYAEDRENWMKPELAFVWKRIATFTMHSVLQGGRPEPRQFEALDNALRYYGMTVATPEQHERHGRQVHDVVYPSKDVEEMVALYGQNVRISQLSQFRQEEPNDEPSSWGRSQCWIHHLNYGGGSDMFKRRYKLVLDRKPIDWEGLHEENW
ncbi:hypothetical protein IAT38_003980 [Cryptococcus sp. DSM 104549]